MKEITGLLQQLSEIAPDVCRPTVPFNGWSIGEYDFWHNPEQGLIAQVSGHSCTGSPALAWLQAAIQAECEARGWDYEYRFVAPIGNLGGRHKVTIFNNKRGHIADDFTTALLAAFVAALGGGQSLKGTYL